MNDNKLVITALLAQREANCSRAEIVVVLGDFDQLLQWAILKSAAALAAPFTCSFEQQGGRIIDYC